jgi:hypothetical protein
MLFVLAPGPELLHCWCVLLHTSCAQGLYCCTAAGVWCVSSTNDLYCCTAGVCRYALNKDEHISNQGIYLGKPKHSNLMQCLRVSL